MLSNLPKEARLVLYVLGLYASFLYWGYLQEKLTSVDYAVSAEANEVPPSSLPTVSVLRWDYPVALNLFMALSAWAAAALTEMFFPRGPPVPMSVYARAAASLAVASPLGYASLKFINFPLMMLTKSCKPIPVMVMGALFYGQSYPWYKYASVVLLCAGIAGFSILQKSSSSKSSGSESNGDAAFIRQLIGISFVVMNLLLDGYTNNEQDLLFRKHGITTFQMMKNVNLWQVGYMLVYLLIGLMVRGEASELFRAGDMLMRCPGLRRDILLFGLCASTGQLLIFTVMKEFGSLLWITVSITRKFITVVSSIVLFNHSIQPAQWAAVGAVFMGTILEVVMNYITPKTKDKGKSAIQDSSTNIQTEGGFPNQEGEEPKKKAKAKKID
jgi:UDP-galactose transporter B1